MRKENRIDILASPSPTNPPSAQVIFDDSRWLDGPSACPDTDLSHRRRPDHLNASLFFCPAIDLLRSSQGRGRLTTASSFFQELQNHP